METSNDDYIKYIKYIKTVNINEKKLIYKKIFDFLNFIDSNGYITYNQEVKTYLKNFIIYYVNTHTIYHLEYQAPITLLLETYEFYELGKTIQYNLFFEKIALINVIDKTHELISKILYEIYLYSTTIYKFSDYYNYNIENFKPINKDIINTADKITLSIDSFRNDFTANSYKLLILGHLVRKNGLIIESPINAYMRITLEYTLNLNYYIIGDMFKDIWVEKYYIPSTPMFYNSLKKNNMLSSCFIINIEDNIESIGDFYKKLIKILKFNSGIGIILSKIRANNRPVMNNETKSKGIFNYIKTIAILSEQFKNYFKKRNTNINLTLSIDHPDILAFLDLKINTKAEFGVPHNNIFQTVSIPDEFMYRYLTKRPWYLISPEQTIDKVHLYDVYGDAYSNLYDKMINDESIEKIEIDPAILFNKIVNTMIQTGGPFLFYKDSVNETSNFNEIINGTNLCTEILIPCNDNETACCNIMSLNLKKFVKNKKFDYELFDSKVARIVSILNIVIDNTYYSDETCKNSNLKFRPMGIGIQGLADALYELGLNYLDGAKQYKNIIEQLYYSALQASNNIARYTEPTEVVCKNYVLVYKKFFKYQLKKKEYLKFYDLNQLADKIDLSSYKTNRCFTTLEENIQKYGLMNTLFVALMPTSFSSGIYNNSESFEPYLNNIYKKTYYEYDIIYYNKNLVSYLTKKQYYTSSNVIKALNNAEGNINRLNIPDEEKLLLTKKYQTLNDICIQDYIKFNNGIEAFVDQGISFNLAIKNNCNLTIIKSLIELWINGKKTIYYYRTDLSINPLMFDKNLRNKIQKIYTINCNTCQ